MKKIILYITILIFGVNIAFGSLDDGLVAYYTFDGNPNDSINNYDGTVYGATLTTGKIGQAYDFDGVSDRISIPILIEDNVNYSYQAWVSADRFRSEAYNNGGIISDQYHSLKVTSDGGNCFVAQWYASSQDGISKSCGYNFYRWYHLVLVESENILKLYLNGNLVAESSFQGFRQGKSTLWIGDNSDNNIEFYGKIDEVGIWNRALTEDEIYTLYNEGNSFQYPFNIPTGTLSIPQATLIIDEVFNEEFTNPIILSNQKVYTSFTSGITERRTYNRYIITNNKRYAIYYGENPSTNINQDNTFYSLELGFQTESELRDALDDLI